MKDYYTTAYGLVDDLTFAQAAMSKLEALVKPLTRIRRRAGLRIEIDIHTRFAQEGSDVRLSERHFVNIMESLRKCVCELMDIGAHVTVTMTNTDFSDARLRPKTWDITSRFVLDAEEWRNERIQNTIDNWDTDYATRPQAAMHHHVPKSALDDMEGFRELLFRRWKVRYALPWIEEE